jgi:alpha,alpha-trehalase
MKKLPTILFKQKSIDVTSELTQKALIYIDSLLTQLERKNTTDNGTHVGLPYPYIVPAQDSGTGFHFDEQYYWDSYFVALGLTEKKHQSLVEGMLENLLYLYRRFGIIPNASRMYMTSRSQPPILTSYIFHIYDTYSKDTAWLQEKMDVALSEYSSVWMSNAHPTWHNVYKGLSRYYDVNVLHDLAEAESGWDMTPRFSRKCLDFLPVDLNALLFKYETDFARLASIVRDEEKEKYWQEAAKTRKLNMDSVMWAKLRGFYFDYNYQRGAIGDVWSLASYYPMWAGMVSDSQAKRLVDNLAKFESAGGLTTTSRPFVDTGLLFGSLKTQWAYPNGWAPLHYFVIEGLRRYGYHEEAGRITRKWLYTNLEWFEKHGVFQEKYNVVNTKKLPLAGVYPTQAGFGWTNGVLVYLLKHL